MGIAAGAEAIRVALEGMVKARNEGRDYLKEGEEILKDLAKKNRAVRFAGSFRRGRSSFDQLSVSFSISWPTGLSSRWASSSATSS